jgi:uncharacterized metal-binding protein
MLIGLLSRQKMLKKLSQTMVALFLVRKKTLEHAGVKSGFHVVVTDLEIQKNYDFNMDADEINKITENVLKKLQK